MRRSLSRLPLQSILSSFRNLTSSSAYKCQAVTAELQALHDFGTFTGHGYLGCGRDSLTKSIQMQVVDALRMGDRDRAATILAYLCRDNSSLCANDFAYILNYCARAPDPLFVLETWRIMVQNEIDLNGKGYLFIIRSLCKGGHIKEAFNLMSVVGENPDTYPALPMYNNCLGACAQMQSIDCANECLDLMERQMLGKNEVTYAELLKLAVLQQNLSAVHAIWKEFIKYYSLSIISLRKFVWSFTKLRDLESAYVALQQMVALAFHGDLFISKNAEGKLCSSRLDIPIPSYNNSVLMGLDTEDGNLISSLYENSRKLDARASGTRFCDMFPIGNKDRSIGINMSLKRSSVLAMKILRWSFTDVIHACAYMQDCVLAEQLILQMQHLGLELSPGTYDGFVKATASRGFHDCMEVLKEMQRKNVKPYYSTLATMSISCSKGFQLDLAEAFLDVISDNCSIYPYNAYLEACDALDRPECAIRLLVKMKQLKIKPDIRTYELLFSLFGNVNAPYEEGNMLSQVDVAKRIDAIEMDMLKNSIQHSPLSMTNVMKAFGTEGMIKELIQYLHSAENQFFRKNACLETSIYNTVLYSLVDAKESHMAEEIFRSMKSRACPPDAATYNIMIDCCNIIGCLKSANALVSMMIRDGFYPQVVTYTTLIKIVLEYEDFDEALSLLSRGCLEGVEADILLCNTILQVACDKGRLDVIELIVKKMFQEKIQPDPSTCSCVFLAYIEKGFFSTAFEALQVLSMRVIFQEDAILVEKRIELEELILSDDVEAESRIIELFRNSEENVAAALLNLRWSAIIGIPISWFPDESQWTKRVLTRSSSKGNAS